MFMGRVSVALIIIVSIIWIPFIRHMSNQIYQYLQSVQAYISAPISAVFLLGILWKTTTYKAAFITLISGGIIGAVRFVLDVIVKSNNIKLGWFQWFVDIPFLNFCIWMFVFWGLFIALVVWGITRLTKHDSTTKHTPLEVAGERYARGEINKEQFEQIKRDLY